MPKDDKTPEGEVTDDEKKVTINGVEMTEDEVADLIESGKTMKELKDEYPDIDFKEMPAEFTKRSQELAEFKKPKPADDKEEDVDEKEKTRREEIRTFMKDPLVREEILNITTKQEQQLKEDLRLEDELKTLEAEFNGEDGRPKFVRTDVLTYGKENNLFNPRAAYKEMHETALDDWKLKSALSKKGKTPFVEKAGTGGGATPPAPKEAETFGEATQNALARASSDSDE